MIDDSILNGTKKALGLTPDYDAFDFDIVMHINSVFSTLNQIGVGPHSGFMITDEYDSWDTFLEPGVMLGLIKSYMYAKVKLLFDPPTTSFNLASLKEVVAEYEWRINYQRDTELLYDTPIVVNPTPPVVMPTGPIELDGGGADTW